MTWNPDDPRITAYVFDELSPEERREFELALESDAALADAVEQTRSMLTALETDLKSQTPLELTDDQREKVRREMAEEVAPTVVTKPAVKTGVPVWRFVAASAACVLLVGGVYALTKGLGGGGSSVADVVSPSGPAGSSDLDYERGSFVGEVGVSLPNSNRMDDDANGALDELQSADSSIADQPSPTSVTAAPDPVELGPGIPDVAKISAGATILPAPTSPQPQPSVVLSASKGKRYEADKRRKNLGSPRDFAKKLADDGVFHSSAGGRALPAEGRDQLGAALGDVGGEAGLGTGPQFGGDKHDLIVENEFIETKGLDALSTFSIDVDTASYAKTRMYLMEHRQLPRRDAVRIEELVNYFVYGYEPPGDDHPFAAHLEVSDCPWNAKHRLVRVALKGKVVEQEKRPASNVVFLLDVSGSMNKPNKLPLLKRGMKMLVDNLTENDQVSIVVYAGAAGLVLDATHGDDKNTIIGALDRLKAGGSTNGGAGVNLAYQTALDHYIKGGVNRVILCTDGDFNVGMTGTDTLVSVAERNAKSGVFLSVLGFGMGNHNDAMLEQISNKGNGNYAFIDTENEARKVLVEQLSGTLVTIAKDVKIQVEFNPNQVKAHRLIGYENRILAHQDFNDDKKDAGEIGAGHTVTALYEIAPTGEDSSVDLPEVDELKYQKKSKLSKAASSGELLSLAIRYKLPDEETSTKLEFTLTDEGKKFGQTDRDFRFAASVAAFGMVLRNSKYKGDISYEAILEIASEAASDDKTGYRAEFLSLVDRARQIAGGNQ
ncbi:MAG: von Willebrand factor type A domain-containing protein [Pirellulaceae bacterium]|jgi:Ca-activated chloride channel family protein|nr:von Willebrand factor type A domain-containing protein [Pirellulaceae bacterium]MDP7015848.1 von Willebrand factor type A domain-containing protein [Pirellulaceae bacterium]